ncbi:MAG: hypothetical protein ACI86M_002924 [Saprospiraceae bacterium]|jgi:hypothetical protein
MDAVKHFSPSFVSYLMDELQASAQSPDFVVGEFFDFSASALKGWTDAVNNGMSAAAQSEIDVKIFDFALRSALKSGCDQFGYDVRNIFNSGIVKGVGGNKDHTRTFVNNHDFRADDEPILNDPLLPYAYILTNPEVGTPSVFYSDCFGVANANAPMLPLGNDIKRLIELNEKFISGASSVDYLSASGASFPITYASGFDNTSLIYQTNMGGATSDKGVVVAINFAGEPLEAEISLNLTGAIDNGVQMIEKTGKSEIHKSVIASGKMNIQVPPRSYAIYVSGDVVGDCSMDSIIYVDLNASGLKNGNDWVNAFTSLGSALEVQSGCSNVNEIRIKEGVYFPNVINDRSQGFAIGSNVTLIGGFHSIENPVLGDQDVSLYPTILSGDIGPVNDVADNIYNVVSATSSIDSASIEALIIEKGNANGGSIEHQKGGGLYNSEFLILKDVTLRNNIGQTTGNGVFNNSNLGKITMDNVKLLNNTGSSSDVQNENGATIKVKTNSEVNE